MQTFFTRVLENREVARGTQVLTLEKPSGFSFVAGQYSVLSTVELMAPDPKGPHRCMSIASAPFEEHLLFAMRLSESGYKQTIAKLLPGDRIEVGAPLGHTTLIPEDPRPVVFLIGGIGITPARSILFQANHDRDDREFFLFYSNYDREDAAFWEELEHFPFLRYRFIPTLTDSKLGMESWGGERGFISRALLEKYLPDIRTPLYYLVGTLGFTAAMTSILMEAGVQKTAIRQDPFIGF